MQVQYKRDEARRCVTVTLRGEYTVSEALAVLERHRVEDDWRYARLYDLRDLTGRPTFAELRRFIEMDRQHQPHGPEALLTSNSILYGLGCAYSALGRSTVTIEVFRDSKEAETWLATQALDRGGETS